MADLGKFEHVLHVDDSKQEPIPGSWAEDRHYDVLVDSSRGSVLVLKPDGSPLAALIPDFFDVEVLRGAYPAIVSGAAPTSNRGAAAGALPDGQLRRQQKRSLTVNKNTDAREVNSGIAGFFEASGRAKFCRQTAWTVSNPDKVLALKPLIIRADDGFREYMPGRHAAQRAAADKILPDWRLWSTTFTTVTLNRNYRTAYHTDAGDFAPGFGVMTAIRRGAQTGAYLVFPRYRTAVDFSNGDLLLADVHSFHGNTRMIAPASSQRVSVVFYQREKMVKCGSVEKEKREALKVRS